VTDRLTCTQILAAIPDAYANLADFIYADSAPPDPDHRRASNTPTRTPANLTVLDLLDTREKPDVPPTRRGDNQHGNPLADDHMAGRRQGILPTLTSWVREIDGAMWDEGDEHQNPPTQRTVPGECEWLADNLDWIQAQPWAHEFHDDIHRILTDINTATGTRPEPQLRCPKCEWHVEPRDKGTWYICTGCNWTWTMANEINRLLTAQSDHANALTIPQLAQELERPISTLKEWRARGWILPISKTRRGYVYDLATVQRVAASIRNGVRTDGRIGA
jgi:hypothetical protein